MPKTSSSGAAVEHAFDLAELERATFGDQALTTEVLRLFDQQAEKLVAEISAASDERTRRELAHRLKGAARGVGAFAVAQAAENVEAPTGDAAAIRGAVAHLSKRVVEARCAVAELIG